MQPITRLVFILLFSTMLLFQVKVSAQENNLVSESQSLQKIELLQDSVSESPQQQVVTLSSIINTCRENDWQQAYLYASMLKIELLLDIEHVNEAEAIFSQLTSTANQVLDPEISIRLDVAQLRINDAKGLLLDIKKLHESLLAKADKIDSHKLAGQVYLAVGNSLYNNSDNIGALKALRNAYTAYETANDLSGLGYVYNTLANVNGDLKNNDIAIEYLEKALTISRTRNDKFSQSINLYNIGNTYIIIGNAEKAREYLGLAMQASIHINDDIGVSWAKKALADIDIEEKKWQSAINLFSEIEPIFAESGTTVPLFEALLGQAKAYLALEQIDLAKQKAAESQDILDKMNVPYYEVELSNVYADIAYAKKEYQLGFDILKQNFEFAQELNLKDKEKAVEKYRIQFDSEIKEKENQTLLTENKLKNLRIEQQNSQQELWWLIAGISSLLLIAVAVMLAVQIRNRNHFKSIALKDYLTDSPNRRSILKQAKLYFSETNQTQQSLTVGIIDIDNFKLLNDKYGHDVGDHVLIAFATASKRTLRKDDKFGRYGGEEWLFVFVDTTPEEIHLIFDRLRDEFNRLIQQKQEVYEPVTFSMGAATFDKSIDISLFSLINRTDKNLYTAKRLGKDQISF